MITKLNLQDFRNFKKRKIEFSGKTTVIVGQNGAGKTNILEAINLLSTGKSFKAVREEEMLAHDKEIGRVVGETDEKVLLEAVLTRGQVDIGTSRKRIVAKKRLLINGVGKRLIDFSGQLKTVLFGPWDMDLITESPSVRRKFLDDVISKTDREYHRSVMSYEKGLRRRNRVLVRIREEGVSRSNLLFWDKLLIKNGNYITKKRREFLDFTNETSDLDGISFETSYLDSAISQTRLEQYAKEEIYSATTLVGPHRDDFEVQVRKGGTVFRSLDKYGSRGEQRMGVLWLKLSELAFVKKMTNEPPTLLLDDIFSELDHKHRKVVVKVVKKQQTIITTADPHFVEDFKDVDTVNLSS